ncbi:hypothetical protein HAX54_044973, partial [Datura stramonium]|nr:hypothetical protein [Datura stramonium]
LMNSRRTREFEVDKESTTRVKNPQKSGQTKSGRKGQRDTPACLCYEQCGAPGGSAPWEARRGKALALWPARGPGLLALWAAWGAAQAT